MSVLTGKALRVKADGTVDGLGDDRHPGCNYDCFIIFLCLDNGLPFHVYLQ